MEMSLGRVVEHDPRSREHPMRLMAPAKLRAVNWDDDAPISDQAKISGCVGFTYLDLMNNQRFVGNRLAATGSRALLPNSKGLDFYHQATLRDGMNGNTFPPIDEGSSGLGGVKGLVFEKYVKTYTHGFSLMDFLTALQHQPVAVGTMWTSGMFDPNSKGVIEPTGTDEGGHEYGAFSWNPATDLIGFRNHWTSEWGLHGRFYIKTAVFGELLANEGDVTIPATIAA